MKKLNKVVLFLLLFISCTYINAQDINNDFIQNRSLWQIEEGNWIFTNNNLKQISEDDYFPAILLKDKQYSNINLSVDFKPISGFIDASGGLIFAAKNKNNYFIVRANALENNFTLYNFKNGIRHQLTTAIVKKPSLNKYHNITIKVQKNKILAFFRS